MNLFSPQFAPSVLGQVYYNTTGKDVIIDKVVARNNDTATQTLLVYLVPDGDTPGGQNLFFSESIAPGKVTLCASLVGSEVAPNGSLWIVASNAGMIAVHGNGRARLT